MAGEGMGPSLEGAEPNKSCCIVTTPPPGWFLEQLLAGKVERGAGTPHGSQRGVRAASVTGGRKSISGRIRPGRVDGKSCLRCKSCPKKVLIRQLVGAVGTAEACLQPRRFRSQAGRRVSFRRTEGSACSSKRPKRCDLSLPLMPVACVSPAGL